MFTPRIGWPDLPAPVRAWVEETLGSPVVSWQGQVGGYSPGTADRLVCADGTRAFCKAVGSSPNPETPDIHREEITVASQLPATVPCAHLLGSFDDGDWVALLLTDIEGRHPSLPWCREEYEAALAALDAVTAEPAPADLPDARLGAAACFDGFARLVADPDPGLDPWAAAHLDDLVARAARAVELCGGDRLVHQDLRSDNMLVTPEGRMMIVDWPYASRGAGWVDGIDLMLDVTKHGGLTDGSDHVPETLTWAARHGASTDDVATYLCGLAGYFLDRARQDPPPGIPTLRATQAASGAATLALLRRLLAPAA